jgi:aryl carrier-like protein
MVEAQYLAVMSETPERGRSVKTDPASAQGLDSVFAIRLLQAFRRLGQMSTEQAECCTT